MQEFLDKTVIKWKNPSTNTGLRSKIRSSVVGKEERPVKAVGPQEYVEVWNDFLCTSYDPGLRSKIRLSGP